MEKLRLNPDNERYYSEAFIKGWKTGVEAQFKADVREQRPKGEWIFKTVFPNDKSEFPMGYLVCPVCGSHHRNSTPCNYCPNCGADMRGETNEDNNTE